MSESTEIVNEVVDARRSVYGAPTDTFARMAQMVSGLLGHEVQPWQIPLILIITKMVRTNQCPEYSDNSDDIEGYLAIFRELVGDDMIHARTVDEFLEKQAARSRPSRDGYEPDEKIINLTCSRPDCTVPHHGGH